MPVANKDFGAEPFWTRLFLSMFYGGIRITGVRLHIAIRVGNFGNSQTERWCPYGKIELW